MSIIKLNKYIIECARLTSFYRYSEFAFKQEELKEEIIRQDSNDILSTAMEFVYEGKEDEFRDKIESEIRKTIIENIEKGLITLRRQLLEASFSIFEKYLCHVTRVYLHTFPQILKDIDKKISFRNIIECIESKNSIFDYIVEKEINRFSYLSLKDKKEYLTKSLKVTDELDMWSYHDKNEFWKDIDKERQEIVHGEELPEITEDFLIKAITYFQKVMLVIAMVAQKNQGIKFEWAEMSQYVKSKESPTLK